MKKEGLIFGIFRPVDLRIFMCGVGITFLLLMIFSYMESEDILMILAVLPVLICTILVMPLKKHHNVLEAIKNIKKQ